MTKDTIIGYLRENVEGLEKIADDVHELKHVRVKNLENEIARTYSNIDKITGELDAVACVLEDDIVEENKKEEDTKFDGRTHTISVRLNDEEYERLLQQVEETDSFTISTYIKRLLKRGL